MVPGDCCFYVYCVNVNFHRKKAMDTWRFTGIADVIRQGVSSRVLPIHQIADTLESDVISVLPTIHALTGGDSTSKIGCKKTTLKVIENGVAENLLQFGKQPLSEAVVPNVEYFFVKCHC